MRDPFDGHDAYVIAYGIQDAIPTETDPIRVHGSRQLDAAMWTRISREAVNDGHRAPTKRKCGKRLELLDCRGLDGELIAFHDA
jgi:hypothetical protein